MSYVDPPVTLVWVNSFLAHAQRTYPGDLFAQEHPWLPVEPGPELRRRIERTLKVLSIGDDKVRLLLDWCDVNLAVDTTEHARRAREHEAFQRSIAGGR